MEASCHRWRLVTPGPLLENISWVKLVTTLFCCCNIFNWDWDSKFSLMVSSIKDHEEDGSLTARLKLQWVGLASHLLPPAQNVLLITAHNLIILRTPMLSNTCLPPRLQTRTALQRCSCRRVETSCSTQLPPLLLLRVRRGLRLVHICEDLMLANSYSFSINRRMNEWWNWRRMILEL